jgi:FixJ family two-component response regulator
MSRFGRSNDAVTVDPRIPVIRVLMIDDDGDQEVITRGLLARVPGTRYVLDWAPTFDEGLSRLETDAYDAALVDYRLGDRSGLEFIREAGLRTIRTPLVLMTGEGDHEVDVRAAAAGATDYLQKGRVDAALLDRSLRYAIANARALEQVRRSRDLIAAVEELGSLLGLVDDRGALLDDVAELLSTRFGFRYLSIYLLDGAELRLAAYRGYASPIQVFDANTARIPNILRSHRAFFVPNLTADPESRTSEIPGMELSIAIAHGQPFGLLNVASEDASPLGDADTHILKAIADRLGAAIALERERSVVKKQMAELDWLRVEAAAAGVHDTTSGLYTDEYMLSAVGQWFASPIWGPEVQQVQVSVVLLEAQVAASRADAAVKHLATLATARIGGGDIASRHGLRQVAIALRGGTIDDARALAASIVAMAQGRWSMPVVATSAELPINARDAGLLFYGVEAAMSIARPAAARPAA